MAKKKKVQINKPAQNKLEQKEHGAKYVRVETMAIVALIALVVGFFGGEMINLTKPKRPEPVQAPAQQRQHLPVNPDPSHAQASKILSLERTVASNPGNAKAWASLGHVYFDSNQPEKAIRAYKKSLDLSPYDADIWTDLGVMYRRNGQPKEAVAAFDKAMGINPSHEISRLNKGIVLMNELGDKQGAIKAWEELLAVNPSSKAPNGQSIKDLVESIKKDSQ